MPVVSEREKGLILDFILNRVSEEEFCRRYPIRAGEGSATGLAILHRALPQRDSVGVQLGLLLGFRFGISTEYLPALRALGRADWHTSHENIAMALDRLKDPESVDVLFHLATTKYAYLAYDDAYALAVKAIYALAKIGTAAAVRRLRDLQNSTNKIIVNAATSRLRKLADPSPDDEFLKFEANDARIDDTRPPVAEFEKLLKPVCELSMVLADEVVFFEREFPFVEFAHHLSRWVDEGMSRDFSYASMESDVRSVIFFRARPSGVFVVGSDLGDRGELCEVSASELPTAISAFLRSAVSIARGLGVDVTDVVRAP